MVCYEVAADVALVAGRACPPAIVIRLVRLLRLAGIRQLAGRKAVLREQRVVGRKLGMARGAVIKPVNTLSMPPLGARLSKPKPALVSGRLSTRTRQHAPDTRAIGCYKPFAGSRF